MKSIYCIFLNLALLVRLANGQDKTGVRFEQQLTWEEMKIKAQAENKFIFLDCYTTWCGPCKYMDKEIFPKEETSFFYNEHFICARIQMDQTAKDDTTVKRMYRTAFEIEKKYGINAYPTFLFFNEKGELVHRYSGAVESSKAFVEIGGDALNPEKQYYSVMSHYEQHANDSGFLRSAILLALNQNDLITASSIGNLYYDCLRRPLAKDNLDIIKNVTISSKDNGFLLFLQNGEKIDSIYHKKVSKAVIEKIIFKEEIEPLMKDRTYEVNWYQLQTNLNKKYPGVRSEKLVLQNQLEYYLNKNLISEYESTILLFMNKYEEQLGNYSLNDYAWVVFLHSNNGVILKEALSWSKKCIDTEKSSNYLNYIDTYANLLYKLDQKDEAKRWEEEALRLAKSSNRPDKISEFTEALSKMKKNIPTWE